VGIFITIINADNWGTSQNQMFSYNSAMFVDDANKTKSKTDSMKSMEPYIQGQRYHPNLLQELQPNNLFQLDGLFQFPGLMLHWEGTTKLLHHRNF
jgi:hypothetical protein